MHPEFAPSLVSKLAEAESVWRSDALNIQEERTERHVLHRTAGRGLNVARQCPVADLIAQAHLGAVSVERTRGLGHHRILNDPDVMSAIRDFVDQPLDAQAPGRYRIQHID